MRSVFKRLGKHAVKYQFKIEVHDLVLPLIRGVDKGDFLLISFERGTKNSETKEVVIADISLVGDIKVTFEETLTLGVTLYQDSQGKFQEKTGTLTVKQRKKGASKDAGKFAYKTIGVVPLELHAMTDHHNEKVSLPLAWCSKEGAIINATITVQNGGDDDDDAGSTTSRSSKASFFGRKDESSSILNTKNKNKNDKNDKNKSKSSLKESDDINDEDDWKADFSKNPRDSTDVDDPFSTGNPFDEDTFQKTSTGGNKNKSPIKSNTKSKTKSEPEDIPSVPLTGEAKEWKNELDELTIENSHLKEREEQVKEITEKAEFYAAEANRLEELIKELKNEHENLVQSKTEIEAELKGRIAENEILVQEVIATKLSLVDLSTELDVSRKRCSQLRQKLGIVSTRINQNEVNQYRGGGPTTGGNQGGQNYGNQPQYNNNNNNNNNGGYNNNNNNNIDNRMRQDSYPSQRPPMQQQQQQQYNNNSTRRPY